MRDILLRNVFQKTLRDQRRALFGFGLGIVGLCVMMAVFYPTIRAQGVEMQALIDSYPPAMKAFFGGNFDDFTSPAGYLRAELFSTMLPLLFLVYAIGRASDTLAGEEERGGLEVLLSLPLSRSRIVLDKARAVATALASLAALTGASLLIAGIPFGLNVGLGNLAATLLQLLLMALCFGALALAIGAFTGRKGLAVGVTSGVAVATFVFDSLAAILADVRFLEWFSPWHYYANGDPIVNGLDPWGALVLALMAAAFTALSLWGFEHRDLA